MFAHSAASDPLTQGDVIEDCPLVGLNLAVLPLDFNEPATKWWTARVIELRDVHSVPRVVLEQLIKGGKRVASLVSPYREHLAQHFAVTYMRVALPEPYATQP